MEGGVACASLGWWDSVGEDLREHGGCDQKLKHNTTEVIVLHAVFHASRQEHRSLILAPKFQFTL